MLTKYLARNPEISSVAVGASGEMCGAVLGGHDGRRGYMHHLGVEPAQRGLGLGRALVARTVAQMARHGLAKAAIVVYSHNEAGFRFWERLGWKRRRDLSVMQVALEPR